MLKPLLFLFLGVWLFFVTPIVRADLTTQHTQLKAIAVPFSELLQRLTCSEQHNKYLRLSAERRSYLLYAPEIQSTPLLSYIVVCKKTLQAWSRELHRKKQSRVTLYIQSIPEDPDEKIREERYRIMNEDFYSVCATQGYCKAGFFSEHKLHPAFFECQPRYDWKDYLHLLRPRMKKRTPQIIHDLALTFHPIESYIDAFRSIAKKNQGENIYASTMSVGLRSLLTLSQKFREHTKKIFLALDGSLLSSEQRVQYLEQALVNHNALRAIPMTPGRTFRMTYHWKMITAENDPEVVFSSMNLSNPPQALYSDTIYRLRGAPAEELKRRLHQEMTRQCSYREDYKCVSRFSIAPRTTSVTDLLDESCNEFEELEPPASYRSNNTNSEKFFVTPQDTDIVDLIDRHIDKAQREILILVHRYNNKRVHMALLRASKRGIKVRVFVGSKTHLKAPFIFVHDMKSVRHSIPKPHMKVMIFDKKLMLFGTGNLTNSGLLKSRELFALSDHENSIQQVLQYASSLAAESRELSDERYTKVVNSDPWIVYDKKRAHRNTSRQELLQYTTQRPHRGNHEYFSVREAQREKLSLCALESLAFIPVNQFLACMRKHADNEENN